MTVHQLAETDMDQHLVRVARYADQLASSADLADANTLTVAADLAAVYEAREWVAEWNEQAPIKTNITGRRTEPDSRSRFTKWLAWKLDSTGHPALVGRRTYQLLNAHEVRSSLNSVQRTVPDSEGTLRPLDWFRKQRLQRYIPVVWARAVELADGSTVTSAHVRAAVNEWKKANRGEVLVSVQSSRMERDRIKAKTAARVALRFTKIVSQIRRDA